MNLKFYFQEGSQIANTLSQQLQDMFPIALDCSSPEFFQPIWRTTQVGVHKFMDIQRILSNYGWDDQLLVLVCHDNAIYRPAFLNGVIMTKLESGESRYSGYMYESDMGGLIMLGLQNNQNDPNNKKIAAHEIAHKFLHRYKPKFIGDPILGIQGAHCTNYVHTFRCVMNPPEKIGIYNFGVPDINTVGDSFCSDCIEYLKK